MKSPVGDIVVTADEIADTLKKAPISSNNGINYWLVVVILTIEFLLLLVAIVVKHYMKRINITSV